MKKKAGKNTVRNLVIFILLALLVLFYYMYTKDRLSGEKISSKSEAQRLLDKDLSVDYPATPSEVVILYSRIMRCMVNNKVSDSETEQLNAQLRFLLDEELLRENAQEDQLNGLKNEVKAYRKSRLKLSYEVQDGRDVVIKKVEGVETASVGAEYTLSGKKQQSVTNEDFLLRTNEAGQWKIVGWRQGDPKTSQDEQGE